jgi:hypothetical protein
MFCSTFAPPCKSPIYARMTQISHLPLKQRWSKVEQAGAAFFNKTPDFRHIVIF